MDTDSVVTTDEGTEQEPRVSRRQLIQQAVALAMQSRWEEAVDANQQIIAMMPGDAEAYNRLGKAYTELGRVGDARQAYEQATQADPANLIAQRQLERLSRLSDAEADELARKAGQKLDPRFFMEETGKTELATLRDAASEAELATLTAGDQVELRVDDGNLSVTTRNGDRIGTIEERLGLRLIRLMQTGNQYQAGIVGVDPNAVRIMLRETVQSPQNAGKISFPPRATQDVLPRPYLREGLLRRASDEEDEDELEVDLHDEVLEDDEEDASDFGFSEGTLDES